MQTVFAEAEIYRQVKRAGDSHLGVPSQCFVQQKAGIGARQGNPNKQLQYMGNLAMKVHSWGCYHLQGVNAHLFFPFPNLLSIPLVRFSRVPESRHTFPALLIQAIGSVSPSLHNQVSIILNCFSGV